jgi:predicted nucleic acid-binding protein
MNTTTVSLDTNILISLLNEEEDLSQRALDAMEDSRRLGRLVVSGPVYAELLGLPSRAQAILDEFFLAGGIEIDWRYEEPLWRAAGAAFQSYSMRRMADSKGFPRRILTDFLIGAHALVRGYTLLTFDRRIYAAAFANLAIISA